MVICGGEWFITSYSSNEFVCDCCCWQSASNKSSIVGSISLSSGISGLVSIILENDDKFFCWTNGSDNDGNTEEGEDRSNDEWRFDWLEPELNEPIGCIEWDVNEWIWNWLSITVETVDSLDDVIILEFCCCCCWANIAAAINGVSKWGISSRVGVPGPDEEGLLFVDNIILPCSCVSKSLLVLLGWTSGVGKRGGVGTCSKTSTIALDIWMR